MKFWVITPEARGSFDKLEDALVQIANHYVSAGEIKENTILIRGEELEIELVPSQVKVKEKRSKK